MTILVNNAGTTRDKLIIQMSLADFDHVIATNLRSTFLCTKAAPYGMLKACRGRIVNISSPSGLLGDPGQANYSVSKAGIIALTFSTAREMMSRNITAKASAPDFIPTELTSVLTEQQRQFMLDVTPLPNIRARINILLSYSYEWNNNQRNAPVVFLCLNIRRGTSS